MNTLTINRPVNLGYQVDLIFFGSGFLKKGAKSRVQRQGCIKQGHCYSKREEARLPLLFLNSNDPVFCTLHFATHILDSFLKFQTLKNIRPT